MRVKSFKHALRKFLPMLCLCLRWWGFYFDHPSGFMWRGEINNNFDLAVNFGGTTLIIIIMFHCEECQRFRMISFHYVCYCWFTLSFNFGTKAVAKKETKLELSLDNNSFETENPQTNLSLRRLSNSKNCANSKQEA